MTKAASKPSRQTAASTTSDTILAGETFDDFRLLRMLGQGGMGQVYLAEQLSLKRKVAIKMLREDVAARGTALARFQSETKTIAKLSHANVVQAYTVGSHKGQHYLAMEYVEGVSLREYIERKGPLEVPLVLSIMRQVANALSRASELDIVHRDIKPENILLTRKGEAKVADFGLSFCLSGEERVDLTRAGATVGTPLYMSPEQIEGKDVDCRSDIYSFGVTCYHMLAGHPPFQGSTAFEVASKHVHAEAKPLEKVRPDVPAALAEVIHKMMAKNLRDRYASARDLLQDLSRVRQSLGNANTQILISVERDVEDVEAPAPVPFWKRPIVLIGGGIAALLAVGVVGVLALVFLGVVAFSQRPAPAPTPQPAPPIAVVDPKPANPDAERIETLKQSVDQYLKANAPKPGGVEACIDLAVIYLDHHKTADAEAIFVRMTTERKPPTGCYYVGRLGLAVTDALHNDYKSSHTKFRELFEGGAKDKRTQVLNDYLTKKPEFAAWVNEADAFNVRSGAANSWVPKGFSRPPGGGKMPFFKK